jgi:hypothetical protein
LDLVWLTKEKKDILDKFVQYYEDFIDSTEFKILRKTKSPSPNTPK